MNGAITPTGRAALNGQGPLALAVPNVALLKPRILGQQPTIANTGFCSGIMPTGVVTLDPRKIAFFLPAVRDIFLQNLESDGHDVPDTMGLGLYALLRLSRYLRGVDPPGAEKEENRKKRVAILPDEAAALRAFVNYIRKLTTLPDKEKEEQRYDEVKRFLGMHPGLHPDCLEAIFGGRSGFEAFTVSLTTQPAPHQENQAVGLVPLVTDADLIEAFLDGGPNAEMVIGPLQHLFLARYDYASPRQIEPSTGRLKYPALDSSLARVSGLLRGYIGEGSEEIISETRLNQALIELQYLAPALGALKYGKCYGQRYEEMPTTEAVNDKFVVECLINQVKAVLVKRMRAVVIIKEEEDRVVLQALKALRLLYGLKCATNIITHIDHLISEELTGKEKVVLGRFLKSEEVVPPIEYQKREFHSLREMDLRKSLKEALENLEKIGRVNLVAVINETPTEDPKRKTMAKRMGRVLSEHPLLGRMFPKFCILAAQPVDKNRSEIETNPMRGDADSFLRGQQKAWAMTKPGEKIFAVVSSGTGAGSRLGALGQHDFGKNWAPHGLSNQVASSCVTTGILMGDLLSKYSVHLFGGLLIDAACDNLLGIFRKVRCGLKTAFKVRRPLALVVCRTDIESAEQTGEASIQISKSEDIKRFLTEVSVTLPEECNLVKVTDFVHQNNNYQFQASELKLTVRGEPMTHEQRQKLITICPQATSQIQSLFNQSRRLTRYKITESGQMSKITLKGPMTKTEFETLIQILEPDTVIAEDKIPEPKTNDGKELKKMFEASQIYDEPFKPLFELGVMSTLKGMVLKFFEKMKNFAVTRGGMRNAVYAYLESENYAAKPVENTKSKLEELGSRPLGDFFKEICDIIFSQEESAALDGIVKADFGDSYHSFCWELYLYNKDPALVSSKKRREAINQVPGGAARQKHLINSAVNACTTLINTSNNVLTPAFSRAMNDFWYQQEYKGQNFAQWVCEANRGEWGWSNWVNTAFSLTADEWKTSKQVGTLKKEFGNEEGEKIGLLIWEGLRQAYFTAAEQDIKGIEHEMKEADIKPQGNYENDLGNPQEQKIEVAAYEIDTFDDAGTNRAVTQSWLDIFSSDRNVRDQGRLTAGLFFDISFEGRADEVPDQEKASVRLGEYEVVEEKVRVRNEDPASPNISETMVLHLDDGRGHNSLVYEITKEEDKSTGRVTFKPQVNGRDLEISDREKGVEIGGVVFEDPFMTYLGGRSFIREGTRVGRGNCLLDFNGDGYSFKGGNLKIPPYFLFSSFDCNGGAVSFQERVFKLQHKINYEEVGLSGGTVSKEEVVEIAVDLERETPSSLKDRMLHEIKSRKDHICHGYTQGTEIQPDNSRLDTDRYWADFIDQTLRDHPTAVVGVAHGPDKGVLVISKGGFYVPIYLPLMTDAGSAHVIDNSCLTVTLVNIVDPNAPIPDNEGDYVLRFYPAGDRKWIPAKTSIIAGAGSSINFMGSFLPELSEAGTKICPDGSMVGVRRSIPRNPLLKLEKLERENPKFLAAKEGLGK